MTFDEAINYCYPSRPELALIEPWISGGTMPSGLLVRHHRDLPRVYGFIWRLHPEYKGPLTIGDMVLYPRYSYEVILQGSGLGEDGEPQSWELAAIQTDVIEAIIPLEILQHPDDLVLEVAETNEKRPEKAKAGSR